MSYLEKLLHGVQVEWKTLDEVIVSLKTGLNPRKNFTLNTSDAKGYYITVREIVNNKIVFSDKTDRINEEALRLINNRSNLESEDILFSGTGTVGRMAIVENTPENWNIKEGLYVIKPNHKYLISKYLLYTLGSKNIVDTYNKKIVGSPVISLPMKDFRALKVPIPPLEIQKEIVRILDSFTKLITKLTAELTAERAARKKQYEYYREELLTFGEEIEWKTLGEVGELIRGNGLPKSDFTEQGVPAIHYGQIYTYYGLYTFETISFVSEETAKKLRKVNFGDVVITNTSENYKDVSKALVYLGTEQAVTGGHATIFKPSKTMLGKYLAYYTQTSDFFYQKKKYAKGTKVIDVSANDLAKIKIPVPSLVEQERIVGLLDKFDTSTNSISEGLPKEIELRKKQYEYYRNLLLTFTKDELGA